MAVVVPPPTEAQEKAQQEKPVSSFYAGCGVAKWQSFYNDPPARMVDDFICQAFFKRGRTQRFGTDGIAHQGFSQAKPFVPGGIAAPSFVVFSTVEASIQAKNGEVYAETHQGRILADYIEAEGLGEVTRTQDRYNFYHGPNVLAVFVWAPDWVALQKRGIERGILKETPGDQGQPCIVRPAAPGGAK
jgi:hypothetical protein